RDLHARLFAALEAGGSVDVARLVHHALGAGDAGAVLRLAPLAAAEAARLGAHREAAAHYQATLDAAGDIEPGRKAELLEAFARESCLTGAGDRAVAAFEEALRIRQRLGDRREQSDDWRWLARLAWFRGDDESARRYC